MGYADRIDEKKGFGLDRCFQKMQALRTQVISGMLFKVEIQQMPKSLSLLCFHDMAGNFIKISIKRRR